MEKTIPIDYLVNLAKAYDSFIQDISKVIPVIKVDWNEFRTPEVKSKGKKRIENKEK